MKFIKYLFVVLILLGTLSYSLFQISGVQDFLAKKSIEQQFKQRNLFSEEDALSALVCGSRSPFPDPDRAETCILVKAGQNLFVVDIGDGSMSNLQKWQVDLGKVDAVLLTHLHSDHIADLPGLNFASWLGGRSE